MQPAPDDLLEPNLLDGLAQRPIDEVRSLRAACQEVETGLSYQRRLVQGPLDILRHELAHRAEGGATDLASLLAGLPDVLAEGPRSQGSGRLSTSMAPTYVDAEFQAAIDALVGDGRLSSIGSLSEADLRSLASQLADVERMVSTRRRQFHERIDVLQAELTRRYASGEASVDSLLADG